MVLSTSRRSDDVQRLPLKSMRVVEISDGKTDMCARLLADLGAEVVLVEPPAGSLSRQRPPFAGTESLYFATHNANKRSVVLDISRADDREAFDRLLADSDIFVDATPPGFLADRGLAQAQLCARHPHLVLLSITDFGHTGPYRNYLATNAVHLAMGGVLCRSGLPGKEPLLPPGSLANEVAAVQATWCGLLGHWQRIQTGRGDHLDFSIYEATAQLLDPAFGVTGSASAGKLAHEGATRDRPAGNPAYQIFPCADGYVRTCILSPRQWQSMSEWLGPAHEFTDPDYGNLARRKAVIERVNAVIGEFFRGQPKQQIVSEGQRRGVPIAAVASPAEVLMNPHFVERGAFTQLEVTPGICGRVPAGYLEIQGQRAGIRQGAPRLGEHTEATLAKLGERDSAGTVGAPMREPKRRRPLEGIRVLDLGVIVAGAEAGRLFADQGADVIKIENRDYPDGARQSWTGAPDAMTPSFALGHRGKRGMGLNLRSERGRDIFMQLVAKSDVVLSNFKPGTMESLGLGYDTLKSVNPRIIMADSSAFGCTGQMSRSMGYGPLVRACVGLTRLWCYPEVEASFSDGVTIYPDHFAARVVAIGALALLIAREQTGLGGCANVSQAETFLTANSEHFLRESLFPGTFVARGNHAEFNAPEGVFPCAGDDEWCVISTRDDDDWARLAAAIGRADWLKDPELSQLEGRLARAGELASGISAWTLEHSPREVTQLLQGAGVPAGYMQRLQEYEEDPQFQARTFFRVLRHPALPVPLLSENVAVHASNIPEPDLRPAPFRGQHTREVMTSILGYSKDAIDELIKSGDLEES